MADPLAKADHNTIESKALLNMSVLDWPHVRVVLLGLLITEPFFKPRNPEVRVHQNRTLAAQQQPSPRRPVAHLRPWWPAAQSGH